ncbi:hypothetical protein B4098_0354 [Heyndrickxia coagulans]|uniref:Uncharacterized protein n=1 Tax=Heyndrickxia coagulans TaxID=1398 RepID=A0A150JW20_HEYCO|nr:hypothetical protein B4098_0354 [Heyndrickxia coagulans]
MNAGKKCAVPGCMLGMTLPKPGTQKWKRQSGAHVFPEADAY